MSPRRSFWFACLGVFGTFGAMAFMVFLATFVTSLGATASAGGWLYGFFIIPYFLTAPLVGRWCDLHRCRPVLVLGSLLVALGTLGYGLLDHWTGFFYLCRTSQGIGMALYMTAGFVYVAKLAPPRSRGLYLGIYTAVNTLAGALVPWLGEQLLTRYGYPLLFTVGAGFALFGAVTALPLEEAVPSHEAPPSRHWRAAFGFLRVYQETRYLGPMLGVFSIGVCYGVVMNFLTLYAKSVGQKASNFFLVVALVVIATRVGGMRLVDRLGHQRFVSPCFILLTAGFGLLATAGGAPSSALYLGAAALYGAGYGMLFPIMSTVLVARTDAHQRGSVLAAFNMAFMLGIHALNGLFGRLATHASYGTLHGALAGVALTGAVAFILLEARARRAGSLAAPAPAPH